LAIRTLIDARDRRARRYRPDMLAVAARRTYVAARRDIAFNGRQQCCA
jgi:hypothetical protein